MNNAKERNKKLETTWWMHLQVDIREWADVGMGVCTCVHTEVGGLEVNLRRQSSGVMYLVSGGTVCNLNPGLAHSARLAGQGAPGIPYPYLLTSEIMHTLLCLAFCTNTRDRVQLLMVTWRALG